MKPPLIRIVFKYHGYSKICLIRFFTDWWDFADWVKQMTIQGLPILIIDWQYFTMEKTSYAKSIKRRTVGITEDSEA